MHLVELLAIATVLLGETAVPEQPPPERPAALRLADLEAMALANNPTLVQAAMRTRAARYKCVQVGLYPNPVLGYSSEEINDEKTAGKQGAFFAQEIVTAGKLRLNRATAAHEVEQAQRAWQAQRRRVLNDVRAGYWDVVLAQRTVELEDRLVAIGEEGVRTSQALLEAQEVSRVVVLQAKVEAESARLELQNARNRHQAAWRHLAAVLGIPDMESPLLAGDPEADLPQLTWADALNRLLTTSPQLQEARAGVGRARCELQRQRVEVVPNVALAARVHYDNVTRDTIAGVEVGLPLPIFDRNQGNIGKAEAELVAASNEVRRIELALQARLAEAFEQYANARQQVDRYSEQILPHAQASLKLVQTGYGQGEFDYLTMLTAQRTYFRVSLAHLESLRELWVSSVAIEGLLLSGGL